MKKEIYTKEAPEPIGPYSQAVMVGNTLYASGQIGLDPETGTLVSENIQEEAAQIFRNLTNVLKEGGATESSIARVDIFMTDLAAFGSINTIYEKWLGDVEVKPARQTVEVSALPKGASVEVSCIANISS